MFTGVSVGKYIQNRRLSLAAQELLSGNAKVIDTAIKYGYDSPESFTKAFVRFHGVPPSMVKNTHELKFFYPLTVKLFIQGGFGMARTIMENSKGIRLIRENFEYKHTGKLRFIGLDLKKNPGLSIPDTIKIIAPLLDPLKPKYAWEIIDYCYLEHHNGGEVNANETGIGGWFFTADTPVPDGCIYYDVPTVNIGYGIYCGDETFGGDTFDAYEFTRDKILGDGIGIPYPEAYWTAVVFIDGEPTMGAYRFGYMFGVDM